MSTLGTVTIPEYSPSLVFPLARCEYGDTVVQQPTIVTHNFQGTNRKINQRYIVGLGGKKWTLGKPRLKKAEVTSLVAFWEGLNGSERPFYFDAPDGSRYTVCFAEPFLNFESLADCVTSTTLTLVEVPATPAPYTISSTVTRFPSAGLNTALLEQLQEIIPLVSIKPLDGSASITVSDRKVVVGGITYQPRLLDWDGISQGISGESDKAIFNLGNADRVFTSIANSLDLSKAVIEFSLFHVATTTKIDLWAGTLTDWSLDASPVFKVTAADGIHELTLTYPARKVTRTCWKDYGVNCPLKTGITTCGLNWEDCQARDNEDYFGGILAHPQLVNIKDNGTGTWGIGRNTIQSRSLLSDSIYGQVLPEIYTEPWYKQVTTTKAVDPDDPSNLYPGWGNGNNQFVEVTADEAQDYPVTCKLVAGRDESEFYAALGIVGAGPIQQFGSGHTLDGQGNHGPGALGLRESLGADPNSTSFSLSETGLPAGPERAAGVSFIEVRRTDEKGLQLSKVDTHAMTAMVRYGLMGHKWTAPGSRTTTYLTNPVWIAVNMVLRAKGVWNLSTSIQEKFFDLTAAKNAAAICDTMVAKIVGTGTEKQWMFRGVIGEEKPLRDWLTEILSTCLGYYTFSFGKFRVGLKADSDTLSAFTTGNIISDSFQAGPINSSFNRITANFGSAELGFTNDAVSIGDPGHAKWLGNGITSQYIPSSVNLVGASTRSQVGRYSATRLYEELGGRTAAEWANARQLSFRTTILALETEPGMICSVTHPDMPTGSGEFRVIRWKLNRDYSIDIQGRTTTDSMYNLVAGGVVFDLQPDPVPAEDKTTLSVPPDVHGFTVAQSVVMDSNGVKSVALDVTYDPAAFPGSFTGVSVIVEYPSGKRTAGQVFEWDRVAAGTCRVLLPPPAAIEDWIVYLPSVSKTVRNAVTTTTPNQTISVDPVAGILDSYYPAAPTQPTSATVSVAQFNTDSATGKQFAKVVVTPVGGLGEYEAAWVFHSVSAPANPAIATLYDKSPWYNTGHLQPIEFWIERDLAADQVYWAYVTGNSKIITQTPVTASAKISFTIPKSAMAPQVTGASITVDSRVVGGVSQGRFLVNFTKPTDPEYWYCGVDRVICDSSYTPISGQVFTRMCGPIDGGTEQTDFWDKPSAITYWRFRLQSVNQAGQANTVSPIYINVPVSANPGIDLSSAAAPAQPTSVTASVAQYVTLDSGQQQAKIVVTPVGGAGDWEAAWIYKSVSAPADPANAVLFAGPYYNTGHLKTIEFWVDRDTAADTVYWVYSTGNNKVVTQTPTTASAKVSFTVTKSSSAPQVSGVSITVQTQTNGGIPQGRFNITFTKPTDPEYWYVSVDRLWSYSDYTPQPGEIYAHMSGPVESGELGSWWNLPTNPEYWRFRLQSVNQAGKQNTTAPVYVNVSVPTTSGIDFSKVNTTTISKNATSDKGVFLVAKDGVFNGFFDQDDAGWGMPGGAYTGLISIDGTHGTGGGKCLKAAFGSGGSSYTLAAANQYKFPTGANVPFTVSLSASKDAGTTGVLMAWLVTYNAAGTQLGSVQWVVPVAGSTLARYSQIMTPTDAGTAYVQLWIVGSAVSAGAYYADELSLKSSVQATDIDPTAVGTGLTIQGGQVKFVSADVSNVLLNGTFESGVGYSSAIPSWTNSAGVWVLDPGYSYGGKQSANCRAAAVGEWLYLTSENVPTMPGEQWNLAATMWRNGSMAGECQAWIQYLDRAGAYISASAAIAPTGSSAWETKSLQITVPAGAPAYIRVVLSCSNGSPGFRVDNVILRRTVGSAQIQDASIDPVKIANGYGIVDANSWTPDGSGYLAGPKTEEIRYNLTDNGLYRWDATLGKYRRKAKAGDFENYCIDTNLLLADGVIARSALFGSAVILSAAIGNAQINDAHISNLTVEKLTGNNITGKTMSLTLNNITTTINNQFDYDNYFGFKVKDNTTTAATRIAAGEISLIRSQLSYAPYTIVSAVWLHSGGIDIYDAVGNPTIFLGGIGSGTIDVRGASPQIKINGTQVLGPRRTGWTAATATASRATFDGTVTTAELAKRFKALEDDLIALGLIGA